MGKKAKNSIITEHFFRNLVATKLQYLRIFCYHLCNLLEHLNNYKNNPFKKKYLANKKNLAKSEYFYYF